MVQMPNRDDATRPGNAIDKLTHEMAEALTAISGYLYASHQLQGLDDPASRGRATTSPKRSNKPPEPAKLSLSCACRIGELLLGPRVMPRNQPARASGPSNGHLPRPDPRIED
jgi:hypothetical protein